MKMLDQLERVSLLLVLLGLGTIYTASLAFEPPVVSIQDLDESFLGATVTVIGNVTDIHRTENAQFFTITGSEQRLTGVFFGNRNLGAIPYHNHRIEGEVEVYRGELELIIRRIEPISE